MKSFAVVFLLLASCAQTPVQRYEGILGGLIAKGKKDEVSKRLGQPESCSVKGILETCEYRTAAGRNERVPDMYRKVPGQPDLSPYDYFDVVEAVFDEQGVLVSFKVKAN